MLACGQPSQEAPKNLRDQPIDGLFLCTFWNIDWQMFFLSILSIQCKIKHDRQTETQWSTVNYLLATCGLYIWY